MGVLQISSISKHEIAKDGKAGLQKKCHKFTAKVSKVLTSDGRTTSFHMLCNPAKNAQLRKISTKEKIKSVFLLFFAWKTFSDAHITREHLMHLWFGCRLSFEWNVSRCFRVPEQSKYRQNVKSIIERGQIKSDVWMINYISYFIHFSWFVYSFIVNIHVT